MVKKLNSNYLDNTRKEEILDIVEDVLAYLEEEDSGKCKTNQGILEVRNLFRGCIVKV